MRRAKFCLCPDGITPTTRRLFEAVIFGCIPVVISKYAILPFEEVLHLDAFFIRIDPDCIESAPGILQATSEIEYQKRYYNDGDCGWRWDEDEEKAIKFK